MKRIIALIMSALLISVMLISCENGNNAVSDYAKKLNSDNGDAQLSADGIDLEFEARGTTLAVVITPEKAIYNRTPNEQYMHICDDLSSMIPKDTIKRECPEISSVIVEVIDPDGNVAFSGEI